MRRALALVTLFGVSFGANATLVTIDPDDYALGTDLSHAGPGVTLQRLSQTGITYYNPTVSSVIAADCFSSRCGDPDWTTEFSAPGFGNSNGWGRVEYWYGCASTGHTGYCRDGFRVLDMVFDSPTDYLQIQTGWGSDTSAFMAFNSAGERILYCNAAQTSCGNGAVQTQTFGIGEHWTTFTVQLASADIARVVFGGFMGGANIGEITYNTNVPEPGTLALFSLGLLGAGLARRRKM
jgi:hypothetical protein